MKKARYKPNKPNYKPNVSCYLCGGWIPDDIVNPHHPLFGTREHVVPVARGGRDIYQNILPAHFVCNQLKADSDVTPDLEQACAKASTPHLAQYLSNIVNHARDIRGSSALLWIPSDEAVPTKWREFYTPYRKELLRMKKMLWSPFRT